MAKNKSAKGTSQKTAEEIRAWYNGNKPMLDDYARKSDNSYILVDTTKSIPRKNVQQIDKQTLLGYYNNVGSNELNFRRTSKYLFYRSNIYYRIVEWYASMWDLRCRLVTPQFQIGKTNNKTKMLKQYNDTLNMLDRMNLQGNMKEILTNVYAYDVCYAIAYYDETGMFFYILDPDDCVIDGRYSTGDFSFAVNMSNFKSQQKQYVIENLGEPLKSMYAEYERTRQKYVHCPDKYAACFKFRTDDWQVVLPPLASIFPRIAQLEDLIDIQATADELSIYKMLYMPMETLSGTKESDDFAVSPDLSQAYFKKMVDEALPDGVAACMLPGKDLKVIDFQKNVDSETTTVEKSTAEVLMTAGGGAVINANKITNSASFAAWLKSETEFALSSLLPQVNGFTNRLIMQNVSNPCKVEHFEVSVYTKDEFRNELMKSCQYSFANRLAYNTLNGISERDTLTMLMFENDVLKLPESMKYPLTSSFTASGNSTEDGYTSEVGQGAPTKSDTELTDSGERDRNR